MMSSLSISVILGKEDARSTVSKHRNRDQMAGVIVEDITDDLTKEGRGHGTSCHGIDLNLSKAESYRSWDEQIVVNQPPLKWNKVATTRALVVIITPQRVSDGDKVRIQP